MWPQGIEEACVQSGRCRPPGPAHIGLPDSDLLIQTSSWTRTHPPPTGCPPCRNGPTDRESFPSRNFEIGQTVGSSAADKRLPGCHYPPSPARLRLHLPAPGRCRSLTEGGTDAAKNVLDPVHLVQSLHCVLGKIELQMRDKESEAGLPGPRVLSSWWGVGLGTLEVDHVDSTGPPALNLTTHENSSMTLPVRGSPYHWSRPSSWESKSKLPGDAPGMGFPRERPSASPRSKQPILPTPRGLAQAPESGHKDT